MSTPATYKRIEENKQKSKKVNGGAEPVLSVNPAPADLQPLSGGGKPRPLSDRRPGQYYQYRDNRRMDFTDDMGGGKQYTSFEKQNRSNRGERKPFERAPPKVLAPQEVVDVPIDVDTNDFKVDPENIVSFAGRTHYLSNLYATPVLIDGHEYCSVEHYYQATKLFMLGGPNLSNQIKKVSDPGYVKNLAKRLLRGVCSNEQVEKWKREQAPDILRHAILQKFMQHSTLCQKLLSTGDAILAHTYDRDNFFATGCDEDDLKAWAKENAGSIIRIPSMLGNVSNLVYVPLVGKGKNVLGAINMQVRAMILAQKSKVETDSADPVTLAMMQALNLS